jgi:ribosomal protein S18 acetylase RimI-like enzyme
VNSAGSLVIRQARDDDADVTIIAQFATELSLLVGAYGYPPGRDKDPEIATVTPEQALRRLQASARFESTYLAELDGQPVGFMRLRLLPYLDQDVPYAEVTYLYVATVYRRNYGIGKALMAHAEELARQHGCTSLHVLTGADNADARAFYEAQGYRPLHVGFEKFFSVEAASR